MPLGKNNIEGNNIIVRILISRAQSTHFLANKYNFNVEQNMENMQAFNLLTYLILIQL